MNHHVFIIHQNPFPLEGSLEAKGASPFPFQDFLNPLRNGLHLAVRSATADEKIIGKGSDSSHFQKGQVRRLLVKGRFYDKKGLRLSVGGHILLIDIFECCIIPEKTQMTNKK